MDIKEMRGILNHVNARVLKQTREALDADIATSDIKRRQLIWYMWQSGRDQAKLRRLSICKLSPHSDDFIWFMSGYYDVIYEGCQYSSKRNPIVWGFKHDEQ